MIKDSFAKLLASLTSVKFWVLTTATWLFYIDRLSEEGWITVVLMATGMRAVNEVAAVYKEIRAADKPKGKAK